MELLYVNYRTAQGEVWMVGSLGERCLYLHCCFQLWLGPETVQGAFQKHSSLGALSPENLSHCQSDEGNRGGIFLVEEELG